MFLSIRKWISLHPYSLMLGYWIFYLLYFFLLERFAVPKYILHSSLDDYIPFMEAFIIPYALWFPLLAIPQGYFLLKEKKTEFQNLCFFMFAGMTISLIIYTFLPNGLHLRVASYPDTILGNIVKVLQGFDTPSNVCPSIHVASTLAIHLAILRYPSFKHSKTIKIGTTILSILIILSTMFLKQHSIIDVVAGIILTLVLYPITYYVNWRKLFLHTPFYHIIN